MDRQNLLFALDRLEALGIAVPAESYELAQHVDVTSLVDTDAMEAAVFFYDWGIKQRAAQERRQH